MAYKADCAVVLALLYYTLQLCQTATQHSEASFFDGRTDELDSVDKLKERTSARWDHFVSETAHSSRLARKF